MKAVIFDMDGVIIDSEPIHFELEGALLEELGGRFDVEYQNNFVGTTDYHMWSIFKRDFKLEPSVEEIVQIKKDRFIENIHRIPIVDGFHQLISLLHNQGYLTALASSNNRNAVDGITDKFDLEKYLSVAISGNDVVNSKPDPEIFLKAAQQLKVDPSQCLVIEDARNGVLAAKAAGMKCIGFKNPNSGNQDLSRADLIIHSYDELTLDIMKNLFK